MATKPKAILSTHDGREASPVTKASNVLFENGQTAQDILNDRQDAMISPVIENSSSMFKVGQGDNVDYSANVVNGAYESMVLKGKTMVNCIQEPSSEDVVLPYEFEEGRYVTINDTKESGALGVELKGQTLVNIHDKKTPSLAAAENDWYSNLVIETNSISFTVAKLPENWRYINFKSLNLSMLKPNTKYLVAFEEASGVSTVTFKNGDSTHPLSDTVQIVSNKAIVTTTSDWVNSAQILYIYVPAKNVGAEVKVKNPMIIEYQEGMENWDIPFFTGMTSCKMPILKSVNQMFDYSLATKPSGSGTVSFTNNGRSLKANFEVARDCTNVTNITLPAGTYEISYEIRGVVTLPDGASLSSSRAGLSMFKSSQNWYNAAESLHVSFANMNPTNYTKAKKTITFDESVTVAVVYHGWNNNPVGWCEIKDIRIVPQGKTSILSLPEEVVLRSLPNGVCDTYNVQTGEYVQNIGEVMFDGSNDEDWFLNSETGFTNKRFRTIILNGKMAKHIYNAIDMQIDRIACYPNSSWNNDREGAERDSTYLSFRKNIETIGEFKQWLSQNPVTVQYPLKTPIVTKIPLSQVLKSWNTTTHIYSEIPENTLYPILSRSNPSYPVILKPSTKYSIVANSYSNGHTNSPINFNLGGATASTTVGNRVTTITTPSALSNELLTMSGRGNKLNNVMVIEGDVVGDEPYFEGMCDSKSPILSNVGKNLFDNVFTVGGWWDGVPDCNPDFMRSVNLTPVKPNTTYAYDSTVKGHRQSANFMAHDADGNFIKYLGFGRTFTTPSNCHYIHLYAENDNSLYAQIEEGAVSTTIEPYKSNILSAVNKNIFDGEWEDGAYDSNGVEAAYTTTSRNKNKHIKVEPSCTIITTYPCVIHEYDVNKQFIQYTYNVQKLTLSDRTQYINFRTLNDKTCNSVEYQNFSMQVVDKTIVLRSLPNGVCDTLDVETGEYVQRIGEVILDGSKTMSVAYADVSDRTTLVAIMAIANMKIVGESNINDLNVDKMTSEPHSIWNKSVEGVHNKNQNIYVNIFKSRLVSNDWSGVQQWLSQNPITVQYELATPIVSTVDIQGFPYAYENGHVILSSGSIEQSLTPTVEYSVATNRNGQIRSNQKMVERHQKQLDQLQAIILANLVNSQYNQTLTTLKYELSRV